MSRAPLELGPRPRGICIGCGLERALRRDGTVRRHEADLLDAYHHVYVGVCPGSGKPPDRPA